MVTRVNPIRRDTSLRVAASPVQSYSPPAQPQRSNLHQLAAALERFSPELEKFLTERQERQNAEDAVAGEAEFFKQNQQGYAEAVRSGRIPAYSSPGFVAGFKKAEGNLAGVKLARKFQGEWMAWPGKDRNDPAEFDAFMSDFLKKNIATDDPVVLGALLPHVRQLSSGGNSLFSQERNKAVYGGSVRAHAALAGQTVDKHAAEGLRNVGGINYNAMHEDLMRVREMAVDTGMRGEDFDKEYVDLVKAKAVELMDPEIAEELLGRAVPGADFSYADTPEGRDAQSDVAEKIDILSIRRMHEEDRRQKALDKQAKDEITAGIVEHIFEDPLTEIPEAVLRGAAKYIPDIRAKAAEWRNKALAGGIEEDPAAVGEVQRSIIEGGGAQAVLKAWDTNVINDPTTFRTLWNFAKKREEAGGTSTSPVLKGEFMRAARDTIRQRTIPVGMLKDLNVDPGGWSNEGIEAVSDYELMLLDWFERTPEASLADIRKAQRDFLALSLAGIGEGAGPTPSVEVIRSPEAERAVGPTPFEGRPFVADPEKRAWLRGITAEEHQGIKDDAERKGIPEDKFIDRMWEEQQRRARRPAAGSEGATRSALTVPIEGETLRQYTERLVTLPEEQRTALGPASVLLAPGPDEFLSAFPPQHGQPLPDPNAGRDLRASIAGAPLTNALLDMIGGAEAPGGYNQRVGDRPGRHTNNLTSMTINQVIALPEVRVGRIRSSASGRYQFLDSTLGQLVEELGLTGDEVFTPAMQDRLAYALLVRRGYLNLLSGAMGPEEFANALSQEWAAVPVVGGPRHGASYYADDGTNQALIDPSQLLLMILKQRQG